MKLLVAMVFGIVQGITEFLPISGGGHLAIIQNANQTVFGEAVFSPTLTFDILLRIGTLTAILVVFFPDIRKLWQTFVECVREIFGKEIHFETEDPYRKLLYMLTVTTVFLIPAAFLNHWTQSYLSGLGSIAIGLLLTGVADVLIDKVGVRKNNAFLKQGKGEESSLFQQTEAKAQRSVSWDSLQLVMPKVSRTESGDDSLWLSVKKAALVGIFQLISLIPGLSRSGMTTLGGLFVGFRRDLAVKYAFLSAIPVLVAKILMQSVTVMQDGIRADWLPYLLGMAAAFVSGVFSIALMRKVVRKYRCKRFGIYCFVIGIIILMIRLRG